MRELHTAQSSIKKCVLTIAGSDSGGNAGVQADLRTFHSYGLHGCCALTALTAQNPNGVYAIHDIPAHFAAAQLDAVLGTYSIAALKTGMLSSPEVIEAVAEKFSLYPEIKKVIDPVMVATSGARLIGDGAQEKLEELLIPLTTVITPNIPEAETIAKRKITCKKDVYETAKYLFDKFGCNVLIKGGHATQDLSSAEDTLFDGVDFFHFTMPWIENPISTHGTGCTLAAAIAAGLTQDLNLKDAVEKAKKYVHHAISSSYFVGENCGVLG
jgi:hydroxymethylpyrimidine kinase/phosphomethylpyrimidine kinase